MRRVALCLISVMVCLGCDSESPVFEPKKQPINSVDVTVIDAIVKDAEVLPDPLAHQADLSADKRVLIRVNGEERSVSTEVAVANGYTIVDLSNDRVPNI